MKITNEDVLFLLADKRNSRSGNLQKFFRSYNGRKMANHLEVIRWNHDGRLYFATLGWLVGIGNETGFAGCTVIHAACFGGKATTGYPSIQKGNDYQIVTRWFWDKYREDGIASIPEVWHIYREPALSHAEKHTK